MKPTNYLLLLLIALSMITLLNSRQRSMTVEPGYEITVVESQNQVLPETQQIPWDPSTTT